MISALFNVGGNSILLAQGRNPCLAIGESSDPSRRKCFEKGALRAGLKSWDVRNQIPVSQSQSPCSLKGKVCEEVLTHPAPTGAAPRFFQLPCLLESSRGWDLNTFCHVHNC